MDTYYHPRDLAKFGEMGEELLLGSQRVRPAKLLESGYVFKYPELETALRHVLQDA